MSNAARADRARQGVPRTPRGRPDLLGRLRGAGLGHPASTRPRAVGDAIAGDRRHRVRAGWLPRLRPSARARVAPSAPGSSSSAGSSRSSCTTPPGWTRRWRRCDGRPRSSRNSGRTCSARPRSSTTTGRLAIDLTVAQWDHLLTALPRTRPGRRRARHRPRAPSALAHGGRARRGRQARAPGLGRRHLPRHRPSDARRLRPARARAGFADRVAHVHLKDVDTSCRRLACARASSTSSQPSRQGLFQPLGAGDVPVDEVVLTLEHAGYAGWYVLEQDTAIVGAVPPPGEGPIDDVRRSVEFLQAVPPGRAVPATKGR